MKLRCPCLVLDHDDTVTDSTRHIHWPAYLDAMRQLRPEMETLDLEGYFRMNFSPGFMPYLEQVLHLTPEEEAKEYEIWQSWVRTRIPAVFPGMARIIRRQKALGGRVCVVSHSVDFNIRRDYAASGLPEPDAVFGWELPKEQRKPSPWPLEEIMRRFGYQPDELLVVDDLKPGYDMARAAGTGFAAAMWAYDVPEIRRFMQDNSPLCFTSPEQLEAWLFDQPAGPENNR